MSPSKVIKDEAKLSHSLQVSMVNETAHNSSGVALPSVLWLTKKLGLSIKGKTVQKLITSFVISPA